MTSRTGKSESPQAPPREQWSSQLGFLIAAIDSAIGLGNIWRFPGVAYTRHPLDATMTLAPKHSLKPLPLRDRKSVV